MLLSNADASMPHALCADNIELLFANSSSSIFRRESKISEHLNFNAVAHDFHISLSLSKSLSAEENRESRKHSSLNQCTTEYCVRLPFAGHQLNSDRVIAQNRSQWKFYTQMHMGRRINFGFWWLVRLLIRIYWIEKAISIVGSFRSHHSFPSCCAVMVRSINWIWSLVDRQTSFVWNDDKYLDFVNREE